MANRIMAGGVIGPLVFVGAWMLAGAITAMPYSAVDDAISRLAAVGSDVRWLMSVGFVVFGIGLVAYSIALRRARLGAAWIPAAVTGVSTIAVAVLPLDHSDSVDGLHGIAAGIGYVSLVLVPVAAAPPLRSGGRARLARVGAVVGPIAAVSLVVSLFVDADGLFQRLGLTIIDAWIVASVPSIRPIALDDAATAAT